MENQFVPVEELDNLVGSSLLETSNTSDERRRDQLVVLHTHLNSSQNTPFISAHVLQNLEVELHHGCVELNVLTNTKYTITNYIIPVAMRDVTPESAPSSLI